MSLTITLVCYMRLYRSSILSGTILTDKRALFCTNQKHPVIIKEYHLIMHSFYSYYSTIMGHTYKWFQ